MTPKIILTKTYLNKTEKIGEANDTFMSSITFYYFDSIGGNTCWCQIFTKIDAKKMIELLKRYIDTVLL